MPGTGPASNLVVSGVITLVVNGQTTTDIDDPLGYTDASAYMTVDFGVTSAMTAVMLRRLRATPTAPWEALLTLLQHAMR